MAYPQTWYPEQPGYNWQNTPSRLPAATAPPGAGTVWAGGGGPQEWLPPESGYNWQNTPSRLPVGAAPPGGGWGDTWQQPGQPGTIYGRTGGGATAFQGAGEFDRLAWQQDPNTAYARYVTQEAGPGSHYERWLENERGRTFQGFQDASRANQDLFIGDYLAQQAPSLVQRYTQLPGFQQGMNVAPNFAGRRL